MNMCLPTIRTGPLMLLLCATLVGCGDEGILANESAQSSTAIAGSASDAAQQGALLKRAAGPGSVNNGLRTPSAVQVPGPPQSADGRSPSAGSQLAAPARHFALPADCVVDFTDSAMLQFSEGSLWADRIYVPWYQSCNGAGYVYMRATVNEHFHLSFADPLVGFCFTHPQAYPSRIDPDGTCHYVDIKTEPRTYVTAHQSNERFVLRAQRQDAKTWAAFDLNRFRVVGTKPVKLCYKTRASTNGPWLTADPDSSIPGSSFCWNELGQGLWDLSGWAYELTEVSIESSPAAPGSIQIDDFHIAIRY